MMNLMLAPLAGFTDKSFRRICFECGCSFAYTEMVSAKGLYYKNDNTRDLLKIDPIEKSGVQLFGRDPEMFAAAVRDVEGGPALEININMGCPVPKVVKNGEGSALLKDPALAAECVKACKRSTKKPVSVKMRIGFEDSSDAAGFAKAMEDAGCDLLIVHARTREQYYSGRADWSRIREIKRAVGIPVIGNGDVFSFEDAERMTEETGCDGVMAARGALGNPWIFQGRRPEKDELKAMVQHHLDLLIEDKGEYTGIRQMRAHFGHYIKGLKGAARLRVRANLCESYSELSELIKEI